jgi:ketosteroid isomerase-like protein
VPGGLRIGDGTLAGRGVYATRDYAPGELVVPYELVELTQAEFDALPEGEREWTHSFWGRIHLFPEPARYVNHADSPSTVPDLDRMGNVALRAIAAGDAITIDDRVELRNELTTFLSAFGDALAAGDLERLAPLLAEDAILSAPRTDSGRGREAVLRRLGRAPRPDRSEAQWMLESYWTSVCRTATHTSVLRRLDGSWRLQHQHAGGA